MVIPANKSQFRWFLFVLIHNFKPLTNITIVVNKRKHGHFWKALAGKFTRPLALRARPSITTRITRTWRYPEKRLIYLLLLQKYIRTLRVFEHNREVIKKKDIESRFCFDGKKSCLLNRPKREKSIGNETQISYYRP